MRSVGLGTQLSSFLGSVDAFEFAPVARPQGSVAVAGDASANLWDFKRV
jgi:hypothetical protein